MSIDVSHLEVWDCASSAVNWALAKASIFLSRSTSKPVAKQHSTQLEHDERFISLSNVPIMAIDMPLIIVDHAGYDPQNWFCHETTIPISTISLANCISQPIKIKHSYKAWLIAGDFPLVFSALSRSASETNKRYLFHHLWK